ncbi:DUF6527 family protein [Ralstonia pseudosolanacearum]
MSFVGRAVAALAVWVWRCFGLTPGYRIVVVEDLPDQISDGLLYAVGESGNYWQAALICPCGCGATIQLPLTQDARPRWLLSGPQKSPTLAPSVHRTVGCRSHFFLRRGRVEWY